MIHYDLIIYLEAFNEFCKYIGQQNKIISLQPNQNYELIMLDVTSLTLALPKIDDGQVEVQDILVKVN